MKLLLLLETIVNSLLVPVCLDDIQLETDVFDLYLGSQDAIL